MFWVIRSKFNILTWQPCQEFLKTKIKRTFFESKFRFSEISDRVMLDPNYWLCLNTNFKDAQIDLNPIEKEEVIKKSFGSVSNEIGFVSFQVLRGLPSLYGLRLNFSRFEIQASAGGSILDFEIFAKLLKRTVRIY